MRSVFSRAALIFVSAFFLSHASAFEWELVPVKSRDYLKVKDISEFYRLKFSEKGSRFKSEREGLMMEGKIDSKRLTINGVSFNMMFPVLQNPKDLLISRYDLATLIDPLLNPVPRNAQDSISEVQISILADPEKSDPPEFLTALETDLLLVLQSQKIMAASLPAPEILEEGPSPAPPKPGLSGWPAEPRFAPGEAAKLSDGTRFYLHQLKPLVAAYIALGQQLKEMSAGRQIQKSTSSGPLRVYLAWDREAEGASLTTAILMPPGSPVQDEDAKPWDLDHRVFLGNMWDAENLQFATLLTSELNTLKTAEDWTKTIVRQTSAHLRSTDCPSLILSIHASASVRDDPGAHTTLIRDLSVAVTKAALRMNTLLERQSLTDEGEGKPEGILYFQSMDSLEPPPEDDADREYDFGMRLKIACKDKSKIDPSKIDLQVYAVDIFNEREVNLTAALPPRFLWQSDEPAWEDGAVETVDVLYRYPRVWELIGAKKKGDEKKESAKKESAKKEERKKDEKKKETKDAEVDDATDLREVLLHGRMRNYGYVARLVYDGELIDEIAHPRPLEGHLGWFATLWPLKQ